MLQAIDYSFPVIFMGPFIPGAYTIVIFIVIVAEKVSVGVVPPDLIGHQVPVPYRIVGRFRNQPETLIASREFCGSFFHYPFEIIIKLSEPLFRLFEIFISLCHPLVSLLLVGNVSKCECYSIVNAYAHHFKPLVVQIYLSV